MSLLKRRALCGVLTMLSLMAVVMLAATVGSASSSTTNGKVLILGSTVSNGAASREAQAALAAGKGVVVVTDVAWASMTAAQFAAYDALVLGDPNCAGPGSGTATAQANANVWGPAVTGNVLINGTDPVFHHNQGGSSLTNGGVKFAAAKEGKTGAYISLSCYYHGTAPGTPVPLLNGFGSFTATGVGCYNNAHITATHAALAGMTDSTLSNWSCSVHEGFDSWPIAFEVLAIARDVGSAYRAPDGSVGTPFILARGVTVISDITLTPESDTNPVGTPHTVTAHVAEDGTPRGGVAVTFKVIAGPNAGATATAPTDAAGSATFTYLGSGGAGTDTIEATFVDSLGRTQRSNRATKEWTLSLPASLTLAPPEAVNPAGTEHCVTASVLDGTNGPAGNVIVDFSVTGVHTATGTGTTSPAGTATFCYTGTVAGTDTIIAKATGGSNPSATATKLWVAAAPASIALAPPSAENVAGQEHCVTATVQDAFGNPVSGASVTFAVSGANTAGGTVTTTAAGNAAYCYTGTIAGSDTITASIAGTLLSATATKTYKAGPPASATLSPATATNIAGQEHCVTTKVTDAYGNVVAGAAVAFTVTGANPGGGTGVTAADGTATFCYTGTHAGDDTITVAVTGTAVTATAKKTYKAASPAGLLLTPKTATNTVGDEHCVSAAVVDQYGNPTVGEPIGFTAGGTAVPASATVTTNAQGQAQFCFTSVFPGVISITATAANGTKPTDTAAKTYVLPASTCGKATGGGLLAANKKAGFGFGASWNGKKLKGSVVYVDKATGLLFYATKITALTVSGTDATIFGEGKANGTPVLFRVDATDSPDTFKIQLSNGYAAGGNVIGKIVVRAKKCADIDEHDDDHHDDDRDDHDGKGGKSGKDKRGDD
jgi:protocatechuate 3,4-dioxygenase beta subunit